MYRKFTITDEQGKKVVLKMYPTADKLVVTQKWEIDMGMDTRRYLHNAMLTIETLMTGNTINKMEIEEIVE